MPLWSYVVAVCSLLIVGCTHLNHEISSYELPLTKQKQRISFLQKKLELAQRDKAKVDLEVDRLSEELSICKLSLMTKWIEQCEEEVEKYPNRWSHIPRHQLFLKEREALYEMAQQSGYAFEAELLLNRLSQIISLLKPDS
jgi:hypothetical protein